MITPPRVAPGSRRGDHRARPHEPDWPSAMAGTAAFLLIAGFCLLLVVHLAP